MTTDANRDRKPRRRRIWRTLAALALLAIVGVAWSYIAFAWVFFVEPGPGGAQLGRPMEIVAGSGEPAFADGQGAAARLHKPIRLAPWGDDAVVFADINNHAIRLAYADGRVETIAGGPDREGHADGPAESARFESPHGVAVRADGAIAVCEAAGGVVRLIEKTASGWSVSTIGGVPGESGARDGPASQSLFDAPHAVVWEPDGGLLVADIGSGRVRRIRDGQVSTVVPNGGGGAVELTWPMDIALDGDGTLWIADAGQAAVYRYTETDGLTSPFPQLRLAMPHGIAVGADGSVIVAEMYAHRILRIDPATGALATICGTDEGSGPDQLRKPAAVLVHAAKLWIADLGNHRIVACSLGE